MSSGLMTVIVVVAIAAVLAITAAGMAQARRRRLQHRFGAEYVRLVADRQSRRQAEAELLMRERHVGDLHIRSLDPAERDRYAAQWEVAQEQFVDTPDEAVTTAQRLVIAVLQDCGYPASHREQVISDLSVDHLSTLDHFRAACDISEQVDAGTATTEDKRQAMIHYHALFAELVGQTAASGNSSVR